jgi:exodeoxyribonuclease V beta subunit
LHGLGITGDIDHDVTFVEESNHLVDDVVNDFYLRKFASAGDPAFGVAEAHRIARKVVANPDAVIESFVRDDPDSIRKMFAGRVRAEVERRRRLGGLLTFDDLLTRLRDTLRDEVRGELACQRLRERYRVALVDEFQDTDPIQWDILRRAFVEGDTGCRLILIGDPKQAIFAFRGADVYAYLEAVSVAGDEATLNVNHRSDQALIDAYDSLFDGARLGHEGIVYRDVRAASGDDRRFHGAPIDAPLRVRVLHREDQLVRLTPKDWLNAAGAHDVVARDVAGDITRLLSSEAVYDSATESASIRPGDIAVLVSRNRDARSVCDALHAVGVPAVLAGGGSVFATRAADEWLRLLRALERPAAANPARALALTSFIGWRPERVAAAVDDEWEDLHARLHRWAAVLRRRGVAALFETVSRSEHLVRRALHVAGGERHLTDLGHVTELLHA